MVAFQTTIRLLSRRLLYKPQQLNTFHKMASKPIVFLSRAPPPRAIQLLEKECEIRMWKDGQDIIPREELLKGSRGAHALFVHPPVQIDAELLDNVGPQLKVVGTMSVGLDHVHLEECKRRGVKVGYTPNVLTSAVAETTICLLLATARRFKEAIQAVHNGSWGTWDSALWMTGVRLEGKVLGIVGLGRIGTAVAKRLKPFEFSRILYCGRNKSSNDKDVDAEYVSFKDLLQQSDFVIATCSIHKDNKELFNKDAFKLMKPTSVFINVTRGALVNQDDLYEALTSSEIAAAGLDVTTPEPLPVDHKLLSLPNVCITPHIGSATKESRAAMCELTARNILAGLKGESLPSPAY